jgi:hypothetical protein
MLMLPTTNKHADLQPLTCKTSVLTSGVYIVGLSSHFTGKVRLCYGKESEKSATRNFGANYVADYLTTTCLAACRYATIV